MDGHKCKLLDILGFYVMTAMIEWHAKQKQTNNTTIQQQNNRSTFHPSNIVINNYETCIPTYTPTTTIIRLRSLQSTFMWIYTRIHSTSHKHCDGLHRIVSCCNDGLWTSFRECVFGKIRLYKFFYWQTIFERTSVVFYIGKVIIIIHMNHHVYNG